MTANAQPESTPMPGDPRARRCAAMTVAAFRFRLPKSSASPNRCSTPRAPAAHRRQRRRFRRPSAKASRCAAARSRRSRTTATRGSVSPSIWDSGADTRAPPTSRPDAVHAAVAKALAIARYTAEDPAAGLADPERLARDIPDLDLYDPWELSVEEAVALGCEAEAAALAVDRRLTNTEGATVAWNESEFVYANTGRLPRRLSQHAPPHRLLGDRRPRQRRRHAARLLVHDRTRRARPPIRGGGRAHRGRAHDAQARGAQARNARMSGAVRGARGVGSDRRVRRRRVGRRALSEVVVPARFARNAGVRAARFDSRGAAHPSRPRQRAVRQRRCRDDAARCRPRRLPARLFSGELLGAQAGDDDAPAMPAAATTSSSRTATTISTRSSGEWDAGSS